MDATQRFADRAEDYRLYRPGYPFDVVDLLRSRCDLQQDAAIVDIAAGTGRLAEIFLAQGYAVTAIEPNRNMREICAAMAAWFPALRCSDGTAEKTGLPPHSADLITVGQALHWFNLASARTEFVRVLRPAGWCAVIYNERHLGGDIFHDGYERIVREFGIDYEMVRHRYLPKERLTEFFGSGTMQEASFVNSQQLDLDGVAGRVHSSSYMPQPDHPRYPAMSREIEALFARCEKDGSVRMEYDCVVHYGRLG